MAHIFDADTRQFYNLDRLWADAPEIKLPKRKMSQEKLGANGSIKRTENRQKVVAEGDFLESLLADLLEKVLRGVLRISDEALKQVQSCLLEEPKEKSFGDISSPCALKLASF